MPASRNRSTASRVEGSGAFGDTDAAVGQQAPRILGIQFVPGRAGQRDIAGQAPGPAPFEELQGKLLRHLRMRPRRTFFRPIRYSHCSSESPASAYRVPLESDSEITFAAHFHDLARRVLGDVARAGDRHPLAVGRGHGPEHFLGEVDAAEAGRLRADQAAAVAQALPVSTEVNWLDRRLYWPNR